MGAYTPEEALAKKQTAEVGRHNIAGEQLGAGELAVRKAQTDAEIQHLRDSFGLDQQKLSLETALGMGNLGLGTQRAQSEAASVAETGRHNQAGEAMAGKELEQKAPLVGAETRHLNAQAAGSEASTGIAMKQQADLALSQMLQGEKPDSQKSKLLHSAANKVPISGYKDLQSWTQAVQKQAQQDAQAAMGSSSAMSPAPTFEARGMSPAQAADELDLQGGPSPITRAPTYDEQLMEILKQRRMAASPGVYDAGAGM